jgi:molybdopterin synthase sulfur carrier subunit
MSVTVHLSGHLKPFADGRVEVLLAGEFATLGDALSDLWKQHAALRERVLNERGEIRQHVNVFADGEDVRRRSGLATKLRSGEIHIFNAVSGG